ncbi:uncharacterized protein [Haliotis asinina]|uniref:uncharacterized protein n=1 Tax=Haliotis asinina TaxID=109174 RepID=UPI003532525D
MPCKKGTAEKRKPNWSADENLFLVQLIDENKSVLRGKFSQKVSVSKKKSTWQAIATQLSVAFPHVVRTTDECEKKYYQRGGQSSANLSAVDQTVQDILGETNVSISGLDEGIDTSFLQVIDMTSSQCFKYRQCSPHTISRQTTVSLHNSIHCLAMMMTRTIRPGNVSWN